MQSIFYVIGDAGDYSRLNNVIINAVADTEENILLQDELCKLLWDADGHLLLNMVDEPPIKELLSFSDSTCFIKVGFYA